MQAAEPHNGMAWLAEEMWKAVQSMEELVDKAALAENSGHSNIAQIFFSKALSLEQALRGMEFSMKNGFGRGQEDT